MKLTPNSGTLPAYGRYTNHYFFFVISDTVRKLVDLKHLSVQQKVHSDSEVFPI